MWELGHSIREISRTHQSVTIEETATTGGAVIFGLIALAPLAATYQTDRFMFGIAVAMLFATGALFCSIRSTFTADHSSGQLIIERKVILWTFRRIYDASTLDRVYVISTRKGTGLGVLFRSGRKKSLTISLGYQYKAVTAASVALTSFLHAPSHK